MQTLHRIRLYAPNQRVPDVTVRRKDYIPRSSNQPDPEVKTTHNDWYAQAWDIEFGEVLFGKPTENKPEEATITKIADKLDDNATTTENEVFRTTTIENSDGDKTSDNVTSFILDFSDNPYSLFPPPFKSPPKTPELPPIVVGYNPRKYGRYSLRSNTRPNVNPDFRMLDSATTEHSHQAQNKTKMINKPDRTEMAT